MARGRNMVPFGTEVAESLQKGTLVMMDAFDGFTVYELEQLIDTAEKRDFSSIVLYPHNQKTLKGMGVHIDLPYSKRLDAIRDVIDAIRSPVPIQIEPLEGKREKYTPIDYALKFMMEKYDPPLFLYISDVYANQLASFPIFDEWIRKIRLLIVCRKQVPPHPKLLQYENRWEYIQDK
ncbi:hypothetical protein LSG31_09785 [Fodinisporobacter ferrooxydans]|uniref:Uncharacterized protein n=1 Tax=Fodinisporobacter ferrooxydans TaxID=2901836 RepID=A0ABY4CWY9_9BACL|nr:hypothetical protein LSG31_09785 [Alicyclobacillaceae bacterium MYW30-H2]